MSITSAIKPRESIQIPEPPVARFFFADTRMAWLWLIVRLYVGYEWFTAGFDKLTGHSITFDAFWKSTGTPWVFSGHDGAGLTAFLQGAVKLSTGAHPAVQGWYATFLQNFAIPNAAWFSYVVTFGELAVGLGLILGCLTGIAAFFGLVMNFSFLMAGAVSINPVLGVLAVFLVLAWRVGGYYGVDRYLLPLLGTPWTGSLARRHMVKAQAVPAPEVQPVLATKAEPVPAPETQPVATHALR